MERPATLILLLSSLTALAGLRAPAASALSTPRALRSTSPPQMQETELSKSPLRMADGPLILTCGTCKATFELDPSDWQGKGRKVKCGVAECDHTWFQTTSRLSNLDPSKLELVDYPDSMRQRLKEGKSAEPEIGFRAYVGNLPFEITEDELGDLFRPHGTVVSVKIMLDPETQRPRGFGFVNLELADEGAAAVAALNGYEVFGRQLSVSEGKNGPPEGRGRGRGRGRGDGRGRGRGDGRGRGGGRGPRRD